MTYKLSSWNLSEVKPLDFNQSLQEIEQKTLLLEKKKKLLKENISVIVFLAIVEEMEELRQLVSTISSYFGLRFAEDSSDQEAAALMSKVETFLAKINNRLLFFPLWFKQLPEKKMQELIQNAGSYQYYFKQLKKTKPYILKENEEKIINLKDCTGVSALNNIYNILTSQFTYDFEGKKVSQNELIAAVRDKSPVRRKAAYQALLGKYEQHKDVLGEIYKNIINDWREEHVFLRGHKNPLTVRNIANDIPDKSVESLLNVCKKNQSLFHDFFELKRKKLGLNKLRRFDLYAPIALKSAKKYNFDQAVKIVLNTFADFSPQFQVATQKIIDQEHIHSQLQKNKHTGAFCSSVTAKTLPYILLNYNGRVNDVSTLAHELGHGIHHILASKQTEFTFQASLPLAETASIFAEMLLSQHLLKEEPSSAQELLFTMIDNCYASIIRQAGFVRFEQNAHQMMKEGKTIQEMSQVYLADLKEQLGEKIEIDPLFAYEWAYIPHLFHSPFYCYAYAFGNLLVLALWKMYQEEGNSFVPKMIELLSKGGSDSPFNIAAAVGIDITSEKFWQKGFDVIKEMIEKIK